MCYLKKQDIRPSPLWRMDIRGVHCVPVGCLCHNKKYTFKNNICPYADPYRDECDDCTNNPKREDMAQYCPVCKGYGEFDVIIDFYGPIPRSIQCPHCEGTGEPPKTK